MTAQGRSSERTVNIVPLRPAIASHTLFVALRFINLDHLAAACGGAVPDAARQAAAARIATIIGAQGVLTWSGRDRADIILFDWSGGPAAGTDLLRTILEALSAPFRADEIAPLADGDAAAIFLCVTGAVAPVTGVGGDAADAMLHATIARLDAQAATIAAAAPAPAGTPWACRYRADMAAAATLHAALQDDRLLLVWQPVVASGGAHDSLYHQALLRLIPDASAPAGDGLPDAGAPYADALERLGVARLLDRWMVSRTIARLRRTPAARLGCALSAQGAVIDVWWADILDDLARAPEVAGRLVIELPERAASSRTGPATAFVARLRAIGVAVAIADFGAGDAALRDVAALDPAIVKIDSAFLRRIACDDGARAVIDMLRPAIARAARRGRAVVMAGVDTPALRRLAVAAGVEWVQGDDAGLPALTIACASAERPAGGPARAAIVTAPPYSEADRRGLLRGLAVGAPVSLFLWCAGITAWRWLA